MTQLSEELMSHIEGPVKVILPEVEEETDGAAAAPADPLDGVLITTPGGYDHGAETLDLVG